MIYLDNSATTYPKPLSVRRKMAQALEQFGANPGRGGFKMSLQTAQAVYDALIDGNACCTVGELALTGDEVKEIGFAGRSVGAVLQKLLDEVACEKLPNTKEALRRRAGRLWRSGYGRHTMA